MGPRIPRKLGLLDRPGLLVGGLFCPWVCWAEGGALVWEWDLLWFGLVVEDWGRGFAVCGDILGLFGLEMGLWWRFFLIMYFCTCAMTVWTYQCQRLLGLMRRFHW